MEPVLLDTDVFSMFLRHDSRSVPYRAHLRGRIRCLCFASVAELRFGALVAGWGDSRRKELENAIGRVTVLHADDAIVATWAEIRARRQRLGRPIASEDCWIAAVALGHGLELVSHNAKDFEDIPGLKLITLRDS